MKGDDAIWFEVIKDHSDSPFFWIRSPGPVAPVLEWSSAEGGQAAEGGERGDATVEAGA